MFRGKEDVGEWCEPNFQDHFMRAVLGVLHIFSDRELNKYRPRRSSIVRTSPLYFSNDDNGSKQVEKRHLIDANRCSNKPQKELARRHQLGYFRLFRGNTQKKIRHSDVIELRF